MGNNGIDINVENQAKKSMNSPEAEDIDIASVGIKTAEKITKSIEKNVSAGMPGKEDPTAKEVIEKTEKAAWGTAKLAAKETKDIVMQNWGKAATDLCKEAANQVKDLIDL